VSQDKNKTAVNESQMKYMDVRYNPKHNSFWNNSIYTNTHPYFSKNEQIYLRQYADWFLQYNLQHMGKVIYSPIPSLMYREGTKTYLLKHHAVDTRRPPYTHNDEGKRFEITETSSANLKTWQPCKHENYLSPNSHLCSEVSIAHSSSLFYYPKWGQYSFRAARVNIYQHEGRDHHPAAVRTLSNNNGNQEIVKTYFVEAP
jgi:hypothetical protein